MAYLKVPYVLEETPQGSRTVDLYSRLLSERVIFLTGEINDDVSDLISAQMFYLESADPKKEVFLYINSPGGSVTAGLAIYDTMQYIRCDVATVCLGQAASMGAVLLAAGKKGKRVAMPNARVMIHQPLGGAQGQASDMEIQVKEMSRLKRSLNDILVHHTGQPMEVIEKDTDRDFFLTAEEAREYGLVDRVIHRRLAWEEVIGETPDFLRSDETPRGVIVDIGDSITSGQTWRGRLTNKKKNGEEYETEQAISPVVDEFGQPVCYVSIARDITREVELEEQLRH